MDGYDVSFWSFAIACIFFALVAIGASGKIKSPKFFFHDSRLNQNTISLTAANITLGSGLAYLFTAALTQGVLAFSIPLGVLLGYFLLGGFIQRIFGCPDRPFKNFFAYVATETTEAIGRRTYFASAITLVLIVVYSIYLPFEVFISAKIISVLLAKEPSDMLVVAVSLVIFFVILFYTLVGGIRAVFRTDKYQLALILMFIPSLLVGVAVGLNQIATDQEQGSYLALLVVRDNAFDLNMAAVFGSLTVLLFALTTQFFNIINWSISSNLPFEQQQVLFRRVGIFTSIILSVFVAMGLIVPVLDGAKPFSSFTQIIGVVPSLGGWGIAVLTSILVLAVMAILFSSADSLMISLIMFWYDNLQNRDSTSDIEDESEVAYIRSKAGWGMSVGFLILMALNVLQPTVYGLLLTLGSTVIVLAPLIVLIGYLHRDQRLFAMTNGVVLIFVGLIIMAFAAGVAVQVIKSSEYLGYVGVTAFLMSSGVALLVFSRAAKRVQGLAAKG